MTKSKDMLWSSQNILVLSVLVIFRQCTAVLDSRNRIVVSTLRCGRSNPGSNPGYGKECFFSNNLKIYFLKSITVFLFLLKLLKSSMEFCVK